jgi:hypothetical protein
MINEITLVLHVNLHFMMEEAEEEEDGGEKRLEVFFVRSYMRRNVMKV